MPSVFRCTLAATTFLFAVFLFAVLSLSVPAAAEGPFTVGIEDSAAVDSAVVELDPVQQALHESASFPSFSTFPGDNTPYQVLRYNRVDGVYIGPGSDKRAALRLDSSVLVHAGFGYAWGTHYWQVFGGIDKRFGEREYATVVGIEGHYSTDTHDAWKIPVWENTLHALFAREDYLNWFRRGGWSMRLEQRIAGNLALKAKAGQDRYEPLDRTVSWALFGGDKVFRENVDFKEGVVNTVVVSLGYDRMPRFPRARSGAGVVVQAELGRRDYTYERYLAEAVVHRPLGPVFTLNTRLRLGSVTGHGPAPKLFAIGGTGTLPGFRLNEFSGNRMALWNSELLLHASPFAPGRIASSISLILSCDIGRAASMPEGDAAFEGIFPERLDRWNMSVGAALGSANGVFRIGAAWRTDRAESPSVVVRLSSSF